MTRRTVPAFEGWMLGQGRGGLQNRVMAVLTKGGFGSLQEIGGSTVRIVARRALAGGDRGVKDRQTRSPTDLGVALCTEVSLVGGQEGLATGPMWVMTIITAGNGRRVRYFVIRALGTFVALETDFAFLGYQ